MKPSDTHPHSTVERVDFVPQLEVDARNMACPMPLLKAKQGLAKIQEGEVVKVLATDPASERDFHSFVELTEHELVDFQHAQQIFTYYLRKGVKA